MALPNDTSLNQNMMSEKTSSEFSRSDSMESEEQSFLNRERKIIIKKFWFDSHHHMLALYVSNFITILVVFVLLVILAHASKHDPTLGVYSPANEAVEYIKEQRFRGALFNNTPYMGYPTDETDKLWEDLYNFGTSTISEEEAKKLPHPTLPIPGTNRYLIQLDVWHELHCLNDLRKILYPDRFLGLDDIRDENGKVDVKNDVFRHWDHCIDAIRQTLMCHADVSPISFHLNIPSAQGVFPRLATTHTCRNFTKIQDWAKTQFAGDWDFNVTREQKEEILRTAGFDQSPFEDIQFLYELFPGDTWFKYWREHPKEAEEARQKFDIEVK